MHVSITLVVLQVSVAHSTYQDGSSQIFLFVRLPILVEGALIDKLLSFCFLVIISRPSVIIYYHSSPILSARLIFIYPVSLIIDKYV